MLIDSTQKYLHMIVGLYDKKKTVMSFATFLKMFTDACK